MTLFLPNADDQAVVTLHTAAIEISDPATQTVPV